MQVPRRDHLRAIASRHVARAQRRVRAPLAPASSPLGLGRVSAHCSHRAAEQNVLGAAAATTHRPLQPAKARYTGSGHRSAIDRAPYDRRWRRVMLSIAAMRQITEILSLQFEVSPEKLHFLVKY